MPPEDEQRIRELIEMHPALLQPEAIELRRHLLDVREDLAAARAELADRDQRLDQAMQDEARITHEWDQARMAIERMGRVLDGGETS